MNRNRGINFEPDANGAGRDGFRDGDPDAIPVINPSEYSSEQANGVQEEIVRGIELLNGTPSYASNEQLGTLLVGLFDGTGSLLSPPTRTKRLSVAACATSVTTGGASQWTRNSGGSSVAVIGSQAGTANVHACLSLSGLIPDGCTITSVRVLVTPNTTHPTTAHRMAVNLYSYSVSGTTTTAVTTSGPYIDDGTTAKQWISSGTISHSRATSGTWAELDIMSSIDDLDLVHLIEVTYIDPKPGER